MLIRAAMGFFPFRVVALTLLPHIEYFAQFINVFVEFRNDVLIIYIEGIRVSHIIQYLICESNVGSQGKLLGFFNIQTGPELGFIYSSK